MVSLIITLVAFILVSYLMRKYESRWFAVY